MPLAGVMLFAKDLPGLTAFYRDVLGLEPIEEIDAHLHRRIVNRKSSAET